MWIEKYECGSPANRDDSLTWLGLSFKDSSRLCFYYFSIGILQPACTTWGQLPTSSIQHKAAYLFGPTLPCSSVVISLFQSKVHLLLLYSCGLRWQGWRHMRMLVKSLTKPVRIFRRIVTSGLLLPNWRKPMETPRWWRKSLTEPSHLLGLMVWKSTESNGYRYLLGLG